MNNWKEIYRGGSHLVLCNGINHYAIVPDYSITTYPVGTDNCYRQCGCFCGRMDYLINGFDPDMLKVGTADDGVTQFTTNDFMVTNE